ncbi:MAG TPA: sigma-70 family RNA polymerase sigma factor [Candidatus Binataceae bacterium]
MKRRSKDATQRRLNDATERRQIEAAQRDPSCFAEVYESNFERVYAFITRRVGDRDLAQDLTADVFHNALKNLDRFEWRGVPFAAWLFRIAANAIADRGKRTAQFEAMKLGDIPEPELSSAANLEEIEYRARLFKLVDKLPVDQRRVIAMRFAHQKSIAEIAKEIGRSEGAIKQLQFRGLHSLRTMVGER